MKNLLLLGVCFGLVACAGDKFLEISNLCQKNPNQCDSLKRQYILENNIVCKRDALSSHSEAERYACQLQEEERKKQEKQAKEEKRKKQAEQNERLRSIKRNIHLNGVPLNIVYDKYNYDRLLGRHNVIKFQSKIENIIIQDVILNRGNCRIPFVDDKISPVELKFGQSTSWQIMCDVLEATVETDVGTFTFKLKD